LQSTPEPEYVTLEVGVLKLNAVIAGMTPYVSVALLLAVSPAFKVVDVTVPVVVVAALTVWENPVACSGWPDLTALKEVKGTVVEGGITALSRRPHHMPSARSHHLSPLRAPSASQQYPQRDECRLHLPSAFCRSHTDAL
jgi:hypothetical protein